MKINVILSADSTVSEISAYYADYTERAKRKYPDKKMIVAFSYKCGTEYRFRAVKCEFEDIKPHMLSVCEKSFSSRHTTADKAERTYKLRLENLKNASDKGKNDSFVKMFFNNECVFDISETEFFAKLDTFRTLYGHCANDVIFAQRAKQKKQKKQENTQMTLTVGHFTEWLIMGDKWSINCIACPNGFDYKDENGNTYEIKSSYGKVKYNGENISFGGSSIEITKDF